MQNVWGAGWVEAPSPPETANPEQGFDAAANYRLDWPRANFLTFFFFDPRGSVCLPLGAAFLREARFSFFRSSVSSILVVSATYNLFHCNHKVSGCPVDVNPYGNRDFEATKATTLRVD